MGQAIFHKPPRLRVMPLQNRVSPFGEIVAIAQRCLFIGNRGIIHDPAPARNIADGQTTA